MLTLILFLVYGSVVSFLAFQNSVHVGLKFLTYSFPDVPLYIIILGSMLVGVLLAYTIQIASSISVALKIYGKDNKIKKSENDVAQLTKRTHQLELENEALKKDTKTNSDDKSL